MPWDLLDPRIPRVSEETFNKRWNICQSCDELRPRTKTCKQCNCFMQTKTTLPNAYCPLGHWDAEDFNE